MSANGLAWTKVDSYCLEAKAGDYTYSLASFHMPHGTISYLLSKRMGQAKPVCFEMEREVPKVDSAAKVAAVSRLKQLAYVDASAQ